MLSTPTRSPYIQPKVFGKRLRELKRVALVDKVPDRKGVRLGVARREAQLSGSAWPAASRTSSSTRRAIKALATSLRHKLQQDGRQGARTGRA